MYDFGFSQYGRQHGRNFGTSIYLCGPWGVSCLWAVESPTWFGDTFPEFQGNNDG